MRNKILIVDDVDINREILRSILEDEYTILEAENGKQALEIVDQEAKNMAAILLDLVMPEMDGTQVLEELNRREVIGKVPVLVISGDHTVEVQKKCFELGISDFIAKPFNNAIIKQRVKNTAEFFDYKLKLEDKVAEQTNVLRKAYRTLQIQAEHLKKKNQQIIEMLGTVVEYRSTESGEHIQRVKGYTRILAEAVMEDYPEYELTKEKIDLAYRSAITGNRNALRGLRRPPRHVRHPYSRAAGAVAVRAVYRRGRGTPSHRASAPRHPRLRAESGPGPGPAPGGLPRDDLSLQRQLGQRRRLFSHTRPGGCRHGPGLYPTE